MQMEHQHNHGFVSLIYLTCILATSIPLASSLSWPLCSDASGRGTSAEVWVTERPRTEKVFPGANLWFFCSDNLNILGNSISACFPAPNKTVICTPKVADAVCQLLGYEKAFQDDTVIGPANASDTVIALTGDYCISNDKVFSKSPPEPAPISTVSTMEASTMMGGITPTSEDITPCSIIQKLSCIRTLDTMATALSLGLNEEMHLLKPAPAAEDLASTARLAEEQVQQAQQSVRDGIEGGDILGRDGGGVGRKLTMNTKMMSLDRV